MICKRVLCIVLILILLLPLATTVESFIGLMEIPREAWIYDPRYSAPLPLLPGSKFNVTIYFETKTIDVTRGWIESLNISYDIEILFETTIEPKFYLVTFKLPDNVEPELYDIYVEAVCDGKSIVLRSPRSLWVLDQYPRRLRILQFTDVHIGIPKAHEFYETAITLANALPVDIIFLTGDNVDIGSDAESLKIFCTITNQARKPTFIVPGNHDHVGAEREEAFKYKYYGKYVGHAHWYRVLGRFLIIGLDSRLEGFIDNKQLSWLEKVLEKYKDKTVIIIMHHAFFYQSGKYTGTWKEIEKIKSYLYSSWQDHIDSAKELLRLIETYNVRLVITGHIHRDRIALYNNKTYFIATSPTGGGPVNYRGFRIIEIYDNGTVTELVVPGKKVFADKNCYNIEYAHIMSYYDENFTTYTVAVNLHKSFELKLTNTPLYFYLNSTININEYKFYGDVDVIKNVEVATYGNYLVFKVYVDLTPGSMFSLTISSYKDEIAPKAKIYRWIPTRPKAGVHEVIIYIKANDIGWGIKEVKTLYKIPTMPWREAKTFYMGRDEYQARLPKLFTRKVLVKVIVEDFAGNKYETSPIEITYLVPTTTPTTTTPTTTPTTSSSPTTPSITPTTPTTPTSTTTTPMATSPTTTPVTIPTTPPMTSPITTPTTPKTSPTPILPPPETVLSLIAIVLAVAIIIVILLVKRRQ